MKYIVKYQNPHRRVIDLEFFCKVDSTKTVLHLPSWRPGRYEIGNFAKNVLEFKVLNTKGKDLFFKKINKDGWEILTNGEEEIKVEYSVFTPDFNAGSCWIDFQQLYVNGIHCFLYNPDFIDSPCELELQIPDNFITVIGLPEKSKNIYKASNFHELVDSPFVCSPTLKKLTVTVKDINFNLWFQGVSEIPDKKLRNDFERLILAQLELFGSFVAPEYHFIFQITPYKHYHGVEHITSTIINIGPEREVFKKPLYNELLGISCHELFHCWNVKTIRPKDMFPYRYQEENYSKLGYVAEGVTTYYGDYLLLRSGVYNWQEFVKCFSEWLDRYYENEGRFNMSVADSSFDTWLDGYVPGVPGRKVSIYNEGALCAFILDILVRMHTKNEKSLDDVMRRLNQEFGGLKKGYSANDYRRIAEETAGISLCNYFDDLINGTADYTPYLVKCLNYLGLKIEEKSNNNLIERYLGLKILADSNGNKIRLVKPGSPADRGGLMVGSYLISINGKSIKMDDEELIKSINFSEPLELVLNCFETIKPIKVETKQMENYYPTYQIRLREDSTREQQNNFKFWANIDYNAIN